MPSFLKSSKNSRLSSCLKFAKQEKFENLSEQERETIKKVIGQKNLNIILHYENIISFFKNKIILSNELAKDKVT